MSNATYIGRIGALAVALGVGTAVATTPAVAFAEPSDSSHSTALIMGGSTVPTPDDFLVESVKNQYIAPTHPGQDIEYVAVTTPEELWPVTGVARIVGLAIGPAEIWGPGEPGWPDVPWWKLSGLFDLTLEQSIQAGLADLEAAMAEHGNDHLVIYGISQSAVIATREKRKLAEQYPKGTEAPDIDFVLQGTPNLPNGGFLARFPGLYLPILDWVFDGPAPTDTQFDTVETNRQYDGFADFPLYPINLIADVNALLGAVCYVHCHSLDVSLPADPSTSPAYQGTHGDTSYYFFETEDLPLFGPLRTLGVPESVIDVVEPFFRVIVELGYDRSIRPWQPTPARLIPRHDPAAVAADLVDAIGEGFNNALALLGAPAPLNIPVPAVTADQDPAMEQVLSAPGTTRKGISDVGDGVAQVVTAVTSQLREPPAVTQYAAALIGSPAPLNIPAPTDTADQDPAMEQVLSAPGTTRKGVSDVGDGVAQVLTAVTSQLTEPPAVTQDDLEASQRNAHRDLAATRDQINETIGAVKSAVGDGRTIVRSAGSDHGSHGTTASPTRKTPVRDSVTKATSDIKKVVTQMSASITTTLSGGKDDDDNGGKDDDNGDGGDGESE